MVTPLTTTAGADFVLLLACGLAATHHRTHIQRWSMLQMISLSDRSMKMKLHTNLEQQSRVRMQRVTSNENASLVLHETLKLCASK